MTEPLDLRYADWRATGDGEAVVGYVRERALRLRERGWRHFGIAALVEAARYDRALDIGPDKDGVRVNNSYRAFIARELMEDERLAGFFEVRRSVADAVLVASPPDYQPRVVVRGPEGEMPPEVQRAAERMAATAQGVMDGIRASVVEVPARWSVEAVPVADRWRCTMPACGQVITREDNPDIQPALGGYRAGICPNRSCYSNTRTGKERGHAKFAPMPKKGAHL